MARKKLGLKGGIPIPIYLPVERYAKYLRSLPADAPAEKKALTHYISTYLNEKETCTSPLPARLLNALLQDGKSVLLLLDGMDEISKEEERILIRQKIQDLAGGKENLRVIVTSRTAAYAGRSVFGGLFQHIEVLPLDSEQAQAMIRRAYQAIFSDKGKAEHHAQNLIDSIEKLEAQREERLGGGVKPLVDSSIVVRMLLIVHSGRKLPEQRAALYYETIKALLRADYLPDPEVSLSLEKRVGGSQSASLEMFQHLAFYMHKQGREQGRSIREDALRKAFADSPYQPFVESLIGDARERGTLLTAKDNTFEFLHLSFQEFLVGRYLTKKYDSPEKLVAFLQDGGLCADSWWREPILLAIGYLDQDDLEKAKSVLEKLAADQPGKSFDALLASCELAVSAYFEAQAVTMFPDLKAFLYSRLNALREQSPTEKWTPAILASAMDNLDRLGYVPADLYQFVPIPNYQSPIYLSRYPVTNGQYARFLKAENFQNKALWRGFEKFDENGEPMNETWGEEAWNWLQKRLRQSDEDAKDGVLYPPYWNDPRFGQSRRNAPVVGVSWYEANAYCKWLLQNWDELEEGKQGLPKPKLIRLPTEKEWVFAAGGEENGRFAFGGKKLREKIAEYANTFESGIGRTTPVWMYPQGKSPRGIMDMSGNVWEWQANFVDKDYDWLVLRGGSWLNSEDYARVSARIGNLPNDRGDLVGFRALALPTGS